MSDILVHVLQWVYDQTNTSICLNLWCAEAADDGVCVQAYTAAADGTECDVGKYCIQGKCVTEGDVYTQLDQHCDGLYSITSCNIWNSLACSMLCKHTS